MGGPHRPGPRNVAAVAALVREAGEVVEGSRVRRVRGPEDWPHTSGKGPPCGGAKPTPAGSLESRGPPAFRRLRRGLVERRRSSRLVASRYPFPTVAAWASAARRGCSHRDAERRSSPPHEPQHPSTTPPTRSPQRRGVATHRIADWAACGDRRHSMALGSEKGLRGRPIREQSPHKACPLAPRVRNARGRATHGPRVAHGTRTHHYALGRQGRHSARSQGPQQW